MRLSLLAVLALLAGCSVGPPLTRGEDPELEALRVTGAAKIDYGLSIAPITQRDRPDSLGVLPAGRTTSEEELSEAYPMRIDRQGLQTDLKGLLEWSNIFRGIASQDAGSARSTARATADANGDRLYMLTEVERCTVRYGGSVGLLWWLNLLNYFTWSPPFTWWVPDETFVVDLTVRVTIREVRTDTELFVETYEVSHEEWLNEFMHGWLILSIFRTPGAFDPSNWQLIFEQLYPHALRQFEKALLADLRNVLPPYIQSELVQRMFNEGVAGQERTFAVVVGGSWGNAERDAQAAEDFLLRHGVERQNLRRLSGEQATPEKVLAAVEALQADKTLTLDRVVFYYSGQGRFTDGGGELACAGSSLALDELRAAMERVRSRHVLFLLDTSFGGSGGRTHPESQEPAPDGYLSALGDPARGWVAIVAAGAKEAAHDLRSGRPEDQYGLMTYFLTSEREPKDRTGDGELSLNELYDHLTERVPPAALAFTGSEQTPTLIGSPEKFLFEIGPR